MTTVVITETLDDICTKWLANRAQVLECPHEQTERLHQILPEADGLVVRTYTQVNEALLSAATKLKVVGRAGVGLDNLDLGACQRHEIAVVHTPDANTQAVVEYVVAIMLDTLRPRTTLGLGVDAQTFHRYRRQLVGVQLDTLTLGILGFGRIGKRLGRVAHALGMKLLINDLLPEADLRRVVDYPFQFVDKLDLYRQSDVLSVHIDGRPENRHLLNRQALSHLKSTCLLINTARGMVLDAVALASWARSVAGQGGGAILDVHEPEPPPPPGATDGPYPLYGLANVRLLPHLAARTGRALENMCWVVKDVWAVLEGRSPRHAV